MESLKGRFDTIFFDADDTLWENEQFFRQMEHFLHNPHQRTDKAFHVQTFYRLCRFGKQIGPPLCLAVLKKVVVIDELA